MSNNLKHFFLTKCKEYVVLIFSLIPELKLNENLKYDVWVQKKPLGALKHILNKMNTLSVF